MQGIWQRDEKSVREIITKIGRKNRKRGLEINEDTRQSWYAEVGQ